MIKLIDGYRVELEVDEEYGSHCDIEKGKFYGSLSYASDNGALHNDEGDPVHKVPLSTLSKIKSWALSNGLFLQKH